MNSTETQNEHEETIKHLFELKFITQTLFDLKFSRTQFQDELESVENIIKTLRVKQYLSLNGNENHLLNLGDYCNSIRLTYTAQKAVREQLIKILRIRLLPIVKFIEKMKSDLPHIYEVEIGSECKINSSCMELINLESQRRECMQKLGELNNQKIQLLKAAMEIKLGPYVCNDLEILHAEMRLINTKANLMRKYIISDFVKRSQFSVKAIKEVEGYIDEQLNEQNEEQKVKSDKI